LPINPRGAPSYGLITGGFHEYSLEHAAAGDRPRRHCRPCRPGMIAPLPFFTANALGLLLIAYLILLAAC
jgi:hypothetical protein